MIDLHQKILAVREQVDALHVEMGGMDTQHYNTALKQALGLALHELNHALAIVQYNIDQECA